MVVEVKLDKPKFELGSKLRDKISGLVGMAMSRTEYLNGCIQYAVMPKINKKDFTEMPSWNIDESQLESLEKPIKIKKKSTGGPMMKMPGSKL